MYGETYRRRRHGLAPPFISEFDPEADEVRALLGPAPYTRPRRALPIVDAPTDGVYSRPRMVGEQADPLTKIAETREYHATQNVTNDDPWWKNLLKGLGRGALSGMASGQGLAGGLGGAITGGMMGLAMPGMDDRFENRAEVAKLDDRYTREYERQKGEVALDTQATTNLYRRAQAKKLNQPPPPKYQLKDTPDGTVAIDLTNPTAPPVKLGIKTRDAASSYSVQRADDGTVYAVNTKDPRDVVTLPFKADAGEDFVTVPGYGRMRAGQAYTADRQAGESANRETDRRHGDAVSRWESAEREQSALIKAVGELNEAAGRRDAARANGYTDEANDWEGQAAARRKVVEKLAGAISGKYGDLVADDNEGWPTRLKPRPALPEYTRPPSRVAPKTITASSTEAEVRAAALAHNPPKDPDAAVAKWRKLQTR